MQEIDREPMNTTLPLFSACIPVRAPARLGRSIALAACAGLLALPLATRAFELGPLRIDAKAGAPSQGEIALKGQVDAAGLKAWIATPEAHRAAGLTPMPSLQGLRLTPQRDPKGSYVLKLEGIPADAKVFDLLVIVTDPKDVVLGEYRIDVRGTQRDFAVAPIGSKLPMPGGSATDSAGATARQPAAATSAAAASAAAAVPSGAAAPAAKVATAPVAPPPSASAPLKAATAASRAAVAAPAAIAAADRLEQAKSAVEAWAQAWSRRDVEAYIAAYVPDYAGRTSGGSREDWIKERTERIKPRKSISVDISRLRLTDKKDSVVAQFNQTYRSDGVVIRSRKTLTLVPSSGGRWLIQSESEGG
jgi:hypothetical protein